MSVYGCLYNDTSPFYIQLSLPKKDAGKHSAGLSVGSCPVKLSETVAREEFLTRLFYLGFDMPSEHTANDVFSQAAMDYLACYRPSAVLTSLRVKRLDSAVKVCKHCRFYGDLSKAGVDKNWCNAFPLASVFIMRPFKKSAICYLAGKGVEEKCKNCRIHGEKELHRIEVKDLRFWGHPATIVFQYHPVDCPLYRDVINSRLSGVHPGSGKNCRRFSNRLVKAVNAFLISDLPELNSLKLHFISEACDIPRNTLKHWRDREQRAAKSAFDQKAAAQRLRMKMVPNVKLPNSAAGSCFLYYTAPAGSFAALSNLHMAEQWDIFRETLDLRHPRAVNRLRMTLPAFFNLAFDYLLFEHPEIPTALGALLLTYLRFHVRYENVLRQVTEHLERPLQEYYARAMDNLMSIYWERLSKDRNKDKLIDLIWISSGKLVPVRKEYERGTDTAAIRNVWKKCRKLAGVYHVAYRVKRVRPKIRGLKRDHKELCAYANDSPLSQAEIAERLLAFNFYALSDRLPGYENEIGPRELRFTEQGDFTCDFAHLATDGGIPVDVLLQMTKHGYLAAETEGESLMDMQDKPEPF